MPRDLATAQAELAEAEAALEALKERVRDGDESIGPEQLSAQRELIGFANLRIEAAQRTETHIRESLDPRGAAAKEAAEQLIAGAGMDDIAAATRAAVDALANLAALAYQRNARIAEVGAQLVQLDDDLAHAGLADGPTGSRRYGVYGDRKHIVVPGVGRVSALEVGALTMTAVVAGLGVSPEGREAQTQHAGRFHGLRDQVIRGLLEQYPQLSKALVVTPEEFAATDQRGRALLTEQGRRPAPEAVEG